RDTRCYRNWSSYVSSSDLAYDKAGERIRTTNARGYITTAVYDVAGRATANIDALANRTTTVYDKASRTVAAINALGNRWTTVYEIGRASRRARVEKDVGAL